MDRSHRPVRCPHQMAPAVEAGCWRLGVVIWSGVLAGWCMRLGGSGYSVKCEESANGRDAPFGLRRLAMAALGNEMAFELAMLAPYRIANPIDDYCIQGHCSTFAHNIQDDQGAFGGNFSSCF